MPVAKNLTLVFIFFYIVVVIYLFAFFLIPDVQIAVIKSRNNIANLTEGNNYFWALLIALAICFIGSASIGFPVPFPFVLFSLSNSVYMRYSNRGLILEQILMSGSFWFEIMGIAIAGGLGCALGELTSFLLGIGAKRFTDKKEGESQTLRNVEGFGKFVLDHPKSMYLYIFIAAALPIPDDPLWIALGMSEKKFNFYKCLLYGWGGKNVTTIVYVLLPILIILGFTATGLEFDDISSVISESIMLLVTITIMFFIMAFDWTKYLENIKKKRI